MITFFPWAIFVIFNVGGFFFVQTYAKEKWAHRRISHSPANMEDNQKDLFFSLLTLTVFTLAIVLLIHLFDNQYLTVQANYNYYFPLYFLGLFWIYDGYIYLLHRLSSKFSVHQLQHKNAVITPLTAIAFHPIEAIAHALFFIIAAFVLPVHFMALILVYAIHAIYKCLVFTNYEIFPNRLYRLPFIYAINPCTHHVLHRKNPDKNFSCLFRFWDDQFKTMNPETHLEFYNVRFQIEKHKGNKEEKYRPDPMDFLGLYFEDVRDFKEDNQMVMSNFERTAPIMVVDKVEKKFFHVHHGFCDGVSALKLLHIEKNAKLTSMPHAERSLTFQFTLPFAKDFLSKFIRMYIDFPYRKFYWKKEIRASLQDNEKNVALLSFTEEETKKVLENAKSKGVSMNLFITYIVIKNFEEYLVKPNFFLPVWYPKVRMKLSEAPLRNNNSGFEFRPTKGMGLEQYKELYEKEMNGAGSYYWQKNFELLNIVFRLYLKFFVWLSLVGVRRSGTISNLGAFKGELKGPLVLVPPILHNCPFSVGVVTYNGELCLGIQTMNGFGPRMSLVTEQLEKVRAQLLG